MTDATNLVEFVDDETPEVETDQDQNGVDDQADEDGLDLDEDGSPSDEDDAEEYEEVERGDKRYKVPKALKDDLLRQEDYTRKTQIHAEEVKRFQEKAAAFEAASEESLKAAVEARAIKGRLDDIHALTDQDWQELRRIDPVAYDKLFRELTTLPQKLSEAEALSKAKRDEVISAQSEAQTRLIEQGQAILARDIPGWGPELGAKLVEFVKTDFGIDEQRHGAAFMDPAIVKLAHAAYKAKEASRKNQTQQRAEAIKKAPVPNTVRGGGAPKTGVHDGLSTEEFARRRNQQLAAKGKR